MPFSVWSKQSQLALGLSLFASVGAARADVVVSPSASLHTAPLSTAPLSTASPQPSANGAAPLPSVSPQQPVTSATSLGGLPTAPGETATSGLLPTPGLDPTLPADTVLDKPVLVPVPGDKPVLVLHAPASNTQAIVYLHGLCGNVRAVESWKEAAQSSGTVIALYGDRACGAGRFRWGKKLDEIDSRIDRALQAVQAARGGLLNRAEPILFGYSQGAARAEALVSRKGSKYRRVILGGPPQMPKLAHLGETRAVAVFGGELETFGHMQAGAEVLAAAGKPARFFLFPKAKHGDFGPDGERVMGTVFSWLIREADVGTHPD